MEKSNCIFDANMLSAALPFCRCHPAHIRGNCFFGAYFLIGNCCHSTIVNTCIQFCARTQKIVHFFRMTIGPMTLATDLCASLKNWCRKIRRIYLKQMCCLLTVKISLTTASTCVASNKLVSLLLFSMLAAHLFSFV